MVITLIKAGTLHEWAPLAKNSKDIILNTNVHVLGNSQRNVDVEEHCNSPNQQ